MNNDIDRILIEIYGGTNQACESGCSGCGSPAERCDEIPIEELVGNATEELHKTFGDSVKVKYIDTDIDGLSNYELCRRVLDAGHRFPITVINGQPRIASAFNLNLIKQILNEIAFQLINEMNKGMEQQATQ